MVRGGAPSVDESHKKHAVFESRAIKRHRESLEHKKKALQVALAEVESNLVVVDDIKKRSRSRGKLLSFGQNKMFSIPMDEEAVEGRLMTPEMKKDIRRNMMEAQQEAEAEEAAEVERERAEAAEEERERATTAAAVASADGGRSDASPAKPPPTASKVESAEDAEARRKLEAAELLDVQIRAIMLQHAEDCKRMHASDAGRLAKASMKRLLAARTTDGNGTSPSGEASTSQSDSWFPC